MKKIFFVITVSVSFLILSCKNDSPKSVASDFLTAFYKGDLEKARNYGTDETRRILDQYSQVTRNDSAHSDLNIEIVKEELNGDKALMTFRCSKRDGDQYLPMEKSDGRWQVAISKESYNTANSNSKLFSF